MTSTVNAIALLIASASAHALAFLPPQNFQGQSRPTPRFKTNVSSVYLEVVVTGPSQLFLPGLTADDFEILEDGVRQEVSLFSSDELTPVTLVLLLDASTSITGSEGAIKKASSNLVREMSSRDEAAVVIFSDTILKSTHFTAFHDPLLRRFALSTLEDRQPCTTQFCILSIGLRGSTDEKHSWCLRMAVIRDLWTAVARGLRVTWSKRGRCPR